MRRWTGTWAAPALVAGIAALVHSPALAGAFVWDDHRFIDENPGVTHPASWLRLLVDASASDTMGSRGILRPLRTVEFAADWHCFGNSPFAFHLHSLLWHAVAAALLVLVLRRLVGDGRAAVVGGLIWAMHPAQVESVALISSRGDVAMGACVLASVLFALRSKGYDRDLAVSVVAAALASLYKETALAMPLLVLVLRWTKLARAPVWPYVVVVVGYAVFRWTVEATPMDHGVPFVMGGSTAATFATMFRGFGFYVAEALLPAQSFDWYMTPSTSLLDFAAIAWLALHLALVASAVVLRTRAPLWTVAVAWFYLFLLPVANWPISLGIPTAERFLYVPLAGFALAVAWTLARAPRSAWAAAVVVAAALGIGAASRARMWTSKAALWTAVLADHESANARNYAAEMSQLESLRVREEAMRTADGPAREALVRRAQAAAEESLAHAHAAIAGRYEFEGTRFSHHAATRLAESRAAVACFLLLRYEESLFHAEESMRIDEKSDGAAQQVRAMTLLDMGFAPQAVASMLRAREVAAGKRAFDPRDFFLRAGKACEQRRLLSQAQAAYAIAVETMPDGPSRREAEELLTLLQRREPSAEDDADERLRLGRLDAELAQVRRSCPLRRAR